MNKAEDFKKQLLELLKKEAFKKGEIVLSSGKTSSFYIDARIITLSAKGAYLTASIILDLLKGQKIEAIGGPTIGADPIVGALAAISFIKKKPLKTFIIRKAAKVHGTKRKIEGPNLKRNSRLVLVDDVATSGQSLIDSLQMLRGEGFRVDVAICIVDRQEGAEDALLEKNCKLIHIFTPEDFGIVGNTLAR